MTSMAFFVLSLIASNLFLTVKAWSTIFTVDELQESFGGSILDVQAGIAVSQCANLCTKLNENAVDLSVFCGAFRYSTSTLLPPERTFPNPIKPLPVFFIKLRSLDQSFMLLRSMYEYIFLRRVHEMSNEY